MDVRDDAGLEEDAPPRRDRDEFRIRVTPTEGIALAGGSSARPLASLSLGQASGSQAAVAGTSAAALGGHSRRHRPRSRGRGLLPSLSGAADATVTVTTPAPWSPASLSGRKDLPAPEPVELEIHPTFRADASYPGRILLRADGREWYVHEDILRFSSPFFQSLLSGGWSETEPYSHSESPSDWESDKDEPRRGSYMTARTLDDEPQNRTHGSVGGEHGLDPDQIHESNDAPSPPEPSTTTLETTVPQAGSVDFPENVKERMEALATPPGSIRGAQASDSMSTLVPRPPVARANTTSSLATPKRAKLHRRRTSPLFRRPLHLRVPKTHPAPTEKEELPQGIKAVIDLPYEKALTVQQFLLFIYPHTKINITWLDVEGLLAFSDKVGNTYLFQDAADFLREALAARPIAAMRMAETHRLPDIYREASRHVLDHWHDWARSELDTLSPQTLLRLERKRSWFLERLLKLGLTCPMRDFECHPSCPDAQACARTLQERWERGYRACLASGPPQPSAVWRYLREEMGPARDGACAQAARDWRQLLFDRMFSLPMPHRLETSKQKLFLSVRLDGP